MAGSLRTIIPPPFQSGGNELEQRITLRRFRLSAVKASSFERAAQIGFLDKASDNSERLLLKITKIRLVAAVIPPPPSDEIRAIPSTGLSIVGPSALRGSLRVNTHNAIGRRPILDSQVHMPISIHRVLMADEDDLRDFANESTYTLA